MFNCCCKNTEKINKKINNRRLSKSLTNETLIDVNEFSNSNLKSSLTDVVEIIDIIKN